MPDLITHSVTAYLIRNRRLTMPDLIIYIFGSLLPDLATRPFMIIYPPLRYYLHTFHTPVAMLLIIYLIGNFFEDSIKYRVMKLMGLGVLTHFFLDLFQASVGFRGYSWFFPFTYWDFNFGLFWPEDSVQFIPVFILLFFIDYFYTNYQNRKKREDLKKV